MGLALRPAAPPGALDAGCEQIPGPFLFSLKTDDQAQLITGAWGQPGMPYVPITDPLAGAGPLLQRSLIAETNSPNAGSAVSGL